MIRAILALLCASLVATGAVAATQPVYVIRHLQKAVGDDPPLTEVGRANALRLADVLGNARIAAIFATDTRRAEETGQPLADRLGLTVTTYDPKNVDALAQAVAAAGGPVLIVGHSNTVPDLVARLGGDKPADMTEADYGTLFVIHPGTTAVNRIELN